MPRTKQAARAYNQRYQAEHRDEMRAKNRAWRAAHLDEARAHHRRAKAIRRAELGDAYAEERRIDRNLRAARRAGLSELDAWRAVLLAERERALFGPTALYGGRFQQLIADAQAARERQAQRADWQPVGGDTAAISDDGWDWIEEAL